MDFRGEFDPEATEQEQCTAAIVWMQEFSKQVREELAKKFPSLMNAELSPPAPIYRPSQLRGTSSREPHQQDDQPPYSSSMIDFPIDEPLPSLEIHRETPSSTRCPGHASYKLSFPDFDGSPNPTIWLFHCGIFFLNQRDSEPEKVELAAFHLKGAALPWFMLLERYEGTPTWPQFATAVRPFWFYSMRQSSGIPIAFGSGFCFGGLHRSVHVSPYSIGLPSTSASVYALCGRTQGSQD